MSRLCKNTMSMSSNHLHHQHHFSLLPKRIVCLETPGESLIPVEAETSEDDTPQKLADLSTEVVEGVEVQKSEEKAELVRQMREERKALQKQAEVSKKYRDFVDRYGRAIGIDDLLDIASEEEAAFFEEFQQGNRAVELARILASTGVVEHARRDMQFMEQLKEEGIRTNSRQLGMLQSCLKKAGKNLTFQGRPLRETGFAWCLHFLQQLPESQQQLTNAILYLNSMGTETSPSAIEELFHQTISFMQEMKKVTPREFDLPFGDVLRTQTLLQEVLRNETRSKYFNAESPVAWLEWVQENIGIPMKPTELQELIQETANGKMESPKTRGGFNVLENIIQQKKQRDWVNETRELNDMAPLGPLPYRRIKETLQLSESLNAAFSKAETAALFEAESASEWMQNMQDIAFRELLPGQIKLLVQMVVEQVITSPSTADEWDKLGPFLEDATQWDITSETIRIVVKELNKKHWMNMNGKEMKITQEVLNSTEYSSLRLKTSSSHKQIWSIIEATCPIEIREGGQSIYMDDMYNFLKDPSLPLVLAFAKEETDIPLQELLVIGRTAYFQGRKLPISREERKEVVRDVEWMKAFFGQLNIIKDRPVVLIANNEVYVAPLHEKESPDHDGDQFRFANARKRINLERSSSTLTTLLLQGENGTEKEELSPQEDEELRIAKTVEVYLKNVEDEMINSPPGTTFYFDGHGMPEAFYIDVQNSIGVEQMASLLRKRYKKWPPPQGGIDILIFGSCYSSNYIRNLSQHLEGESMNAIAIATSEYGYVGFGTTMNKSEKAKKSPFQKYPISNDAFLNTIFTFEDLEQLNINKLLEYQNNQHERGQIQNNYSIFMLGKTGLLQFGMNEEQNPLHELAQQENV
jgi:hypothetical protein